MGGGFPFDLRNQIFYHKRGENPRKEDKSAKDCESSVLSGATDNAEKTGESFAANENGKIRQ